MKNTKYIFEDVPLNRKEHHRLLQSLLWNALHLLDQLEEHLDNPQKHKKRILRRIKSDHPKYNTEEAMSSIPKYAIHIRNGRVVSVGGKKPKSQ